MMILRRWVFTPPPDNDLVVYANSNPLVPIRFVSIQLGETKNLLQGIQTILKFLTQVSQVCYLENVPTGISHADYLARFERLVGLERYIGTRGQYVIEPVCKFIYIPHQGSVLRPHMGTGDIGLGALNFYKWHESRKNPFYIHRPDRTCHKTTTCKFYRGSDKIKTTSGDVLTIVNGYGEINGPATSPYKSWTIRVQDTTGLIFWLDWSANYLDDFALPNIGDTACFSLLTIPSDCTAVSFDVYLNPEQDDRVRFNAISLNILHNPQNLKELIESIHEFLKSKHVEAPTQ
jgi:hypothetical protein